MANNKEIVYKYDNRGNCIYEKHYNGYEYWYEYDKNNNIIYNREYNS